MTFTFSLSNVSASSRLPLVTADVTSPAALAALISGKMRGCKNGSPPATTRKAKEFLNSSILSNFSIFSFFSVRKQGGEWLASVQNR